MTKDEGVKRIKKLYGKGAYWRDNGRSTSPEQREAARIDYQAARARKKAASEAVDARRRIVLKADAEYQAALAELTAADKAEAVSRGRGGYRLAVGVNIGIGFMVRAEGDNWADVVRKAEALLGVNERRSA